MDHIKEKAQNAVRKAGEIILNSQKDSSIVFEKGAKNYVTQIDFAVQDYLVKKLVEIIPGSNIISEESEENSFVMDKPTWILDPVDGTSNIMRQYCHSAVSLALFIDGKPSLGFIYNPYLDEMFSAEAGKGAFLNGRKISVSSNSNMKDCLISFGTTPYSREEAHRTFYIAEQIFINALDVRRSGSAALDIAYVACGRTDGFFELNLQPWDCAAGILILEEAGGVATNWNGDPVSMKHSDSILASNGIVHKKLLEYMAQK